MENLDEMKAFWSKIQENNENFKPINKDQIMENLTVKSNGIFELLKKNVEKEISLIKGCVIIFVIALITADQIEARFFYGTMIILTIIMIGYFWKDYQKIKLFNSSKQSIKENLDEDIQYLAHFINVYFKINMLVWPLTGIFYYFMPRIVSTSISKINNRTTSISENTSIFESINFPILFAVMGITTLLGYYFQVWYVNKMYGKHLSALKVVKSELDSEV